MSAREQAGRICLITGAGSGIGAATARKLARPGLRLALHAAGATAASQERLETVASECVRLGAETHTMLGDLDVAGQAAGLVRTTIARFGGLDHLVSNAGSADRRTLEELSRPDFDRPHRVMAGALFEMAQEALASIAGSDCGRIIVISSFIAHRYRNGELFLASAAAKAACESLAKSLAAVLAPKGATVNVIAPGYTRRGDATKPIDLARMARGAELTPMQRIGEPEDIAALAAFLLSDAARQITGQTICVDGGLTL